MPLAMNPLCEIRPWNLQDMTRLMKCKGTIQDVDGACSFKVSGRSGTGCQLAAHYRMPLHALNKKFGLYRQIVAHLDVSPHTNAPRMRDTYLSIMDYMNNVRIGFMHDASRSPDALCRDFRSPSVASMLGIVGLWKKLMESPSKAYRIRHVQTFFYFSCGGGEDVQHLLNALDASLDPPRATADSGRAMEPMHSIDMDNSNPSLETEQNHGDTLSNTFPKFPLPFDKTSQIIALQTLSGCARQLLVDGFGKWLPSHIAMRFREIQGLDHNESLENLVENGLLITARSYDEFLEIFGMAEMMMKCQDLLVDRGGMARFFTAAGHALHTSRQGKECLVEYGQDFPLPITTQEQFETLTSGESGSYVYCGIRRRDTDVHQIPSYSGPRKCPTLRQNTPTNSGHTHVCSEDMRSFADCEVQTDDVCLFMEVHAPYSLCDASQQDNGDTHMYHNYEHQPPKDVPLYTECEVQTDLDIEYETQMINPVHLASDSNLQSHLDVQSLSPFMDFGAIELESNNEHSECFEISHTLVNNDSRHTIDGNNDDAFNMPGEEHTLSIELSQNFSNHSYDTINGYSDEDFDTTHMHRFNESYEINDENAVQQNTDICVPLPLKSRLRSHNTARPQLMHITSNEELPDSKKARPVVFSKNRPARRGKSNLVNSKTIVRKYTLNDLIRECHSQEMNDTPFGYQFVASTIELNHDSWLDVARYVAAHCVLAELTTRSMMDEESVRGVLQNILVTIFTFS
ncbi:hypothetical protein EV424DRAFT_1348130 [Suillus variegatus]|nr:hypothetical protein EV424DRAFT_1348130 [Suillus variegatus]